MFFSLLKVLKGTKLNKYFEELRNEKIKSDSNVEEIIKIFNEIFIKEEEKDTTNKNEKKKKRKI